MNTLQHFDTRAPRWDELYRSQRFKDRLSLFVEGVRASVAPGATVLDYGCGTGRIALELARRAYRLEGVDGSSAMVEQATRNAAAEGLSTVSFRAIDPDTWHAGRRYDAVVCSSVIEYVPDDARLLQRLAEALAPGGALLISVPNRDSLARKAIDAARSARNRLLGRRHDLQYTRHQYSPASFAGMLERAGFEPPQWTSFELPVLGTLGVGLSRMPMLGAMMLATTRRRH
ncbi:MAG TPA: class I SAM-dependent methyltransferase [Burkholderiales bacterium]|jgi:2-polyprenyl-6-hydroxyphenyl methylase/3-demethylubiquinone-9 3-methyltransferase|nr:class I SAM-dependent methyltransferase [Burkholderiales bacterium]